VLHDVFGEYAGDYDRWFDEHRDEYLAELSRIRQVLPAPGTQAIEVGVGSGRFAAPLGIRVGVEPSLALCRMAYRRGVEVIRGRAEALPIKDGSSSLLLLVTVICYLDDPKAALVELYRVLIPGGFLIVAFIERAGQIHGKYLKEGGKGRFLSEGRFYSPEEVRTFLEETKFKVIKVDSRVGFCIIAGQKD
jgi:ubiquinone/menaquinone biosynthesis C-methylase UbiE